MVFYKENLKKIIISGYDSSKISCLKQPVHAMIETKNGKRFFGSNTMGNNPGICPRLGMKSGEGYDLCKDICKQEFHAEVSAIKNAQKNGEDLKGSTLFLTGHTYCCSNCTEKMKEAGIENVEIVDTEETILLN